MVSILVTAPIVVMASVVASAQDSSAIAEEGRTNLVITELAAALEHQSEITLEWMNSLPPPPQHRRPALPGEPPPQEAPRPPKPPPEPPERLDTNPEMIEAIENLTAAAVELSRYPNVKESLVKDVIVVQNDLAASYEAMSTGVLGGNAVTTFLRDTQAYEAELRGIFEEMRADSQYALQMTLEEADATAAQLRVVAPVAALAGILAGIYVLRFRASRRREDRLAQAVDDKNQFIGSVSHELRTPLTGIIGFCEELRDGDDLSHDTRRELLDIVTTQAIEMRDIVEDLLVAARADIGTVSIAAEDIDLDAIACRVVDEYTQPGTEPPGLGLGNAWAHADPIRSRQVIRNLLTNAGRYGGPTVTVLSGRDSACAYLEVTDDGNGVPDGHESRIFEPYATTGASAPGSVGLGLSVSRGLARLMGGDLTYQRRGPLTVFRLSLPRATVPAAAEEPVGQSTI